MQLLKIVPKCTKTCNFHTKIQIFLWRSTAPWEGNIVPHTPPLKWPLIQLDSGYATADSQSNRTVLLQKQMQILGQNPWTDADSKFQDLYISGARSAASSASLQTDIKAT